jgi:hypothetical protein
MEWLLFRMLDAKEVSITSSMKAVKSAVLDFVVDKLLSRLFRGRFESPSAEDIGIRNFVLRTQD